MSRKKKIKPCLGDVFTFKLKNGFNCFGQIVAPCPKDNGDMLYILFDFASVDQPILSDIVKKPILAIANLVPGDIEDGSWAIIGNDEIPASSIVLPNYVITDQRDDPVVLRYDGTFVRSSTIEEQMLSVTGKIPNLRAWVTHTGGFEEIASYRFNNGDWHEFYEVILFEGSMWDAKANPDGMPLGDFLEKPAIASNHYELMMIKKELTQLYFIRASASDRKLYIEEGHVGKKPKYTQFNIFDEFTDQSAIEHVEKQLLSDRFEQFEDDQYQTVTIRYGLDTDGFGTEDDLERRYRIEELLGEKLRATNNGDCTGGEIGNGEMIIFCDVIDQEIALKTIKKSLKQNGYLQNAHISLA